VEAEVDEKIVQGSEEWHSAEDEKLTGKYFFVQSGVMNTHRDSIEDIQKNGVCALVSGIAAVIEAIQRDVLYWMNVSYF